MTRRVWIVRALDATSQWGNTVFLNGDPNESISGRSFREASIEQPTHRGWRFMYRFVNFLFFWEDNHCRLAYENDVSRAARLLTYHRQKNWEDGHEPTG